MAFESAERAADDAAVGPYLTFVVVGAGPTGVEMAGAWPSWRGKRCRATSGGLIPRGRGFS